MDQNWWTEVSGTCPLICWHVLFFACFLKGGSVIISCLIISCLHVVVVLCEVAIVLQSKCIRPFRDTATGLNLSLTTDHMYLLHSMDFGSSIQWSWCRNYFWLCLLLLSTLCLCRFPFHMQDMILMRSYYRLSSLAITSVDGCFLYIITHKSILHRTWL